MSERSGPRNGRPNPPRPAGAENLRERRLVRYYIDCIESEGTRELVLPDSARSERFMLLSTGEESVLTSDEGDWRVLLADEKLATWTKKRAMASRSERVLYGYPIIVGSRDEGQVYAPLFYAEVGLRVDGNEVQVRPESGLIEVSLFALDLLGVDRQERSAILEQVEAVDEPTDAHGRLSAKLALLADLGVFPSEELGLLDPSELHAPPVDEGVANTAMVFVGERALVTRQLLDDLDELALASDATFRQGPLGILLGAEQAPLASSPQPQPAILPTNLSQDRAITGALESVFTVVTGPPGTGKSQVLVNTVAAALDRGETVLFASKNNQAVDVVFDRLAAVSSEATPLRVGAARLRGGTAHAIRTALSRAKTSEPSISAARRAWAEMSAALAPLYQVEKQRVEALRRLSLEEARYSALADGMRAALLLVDDPGEIERALRTVESAQTRATAHVWWPFFGSRIRERRRQAVHEAWTTLRESLPAPVADEYPVALPDEQLPRIVDEIGSVCRVARQAAAVRDARQQLESLPDSWDVQEAIRERDGDRIRIGRRLFDAHWVSRIRNADGSVRSRASTYADGLERLAQGRGGSAPRLRSSVRSVLGMFPVWGVTNLSARTNLPLEAGLFNLVVIDEASQCDIASAIPLLHRAKRALIIGDRNQLIHVSTLPASQDEVFAKHHGLTDDDFMSMGYRVTSLFGVAARRVGEDPVFLEEHYRSHRAIITFSNDLFYGSRLIILTEQGDRLDGPAVRWIDVSGSFSKGPRGSSVVNAPEVRAVAETVKSLLVGDTSDLSLGVVTPYRAQVEAIRDALQGRVKAGDDGLTVDTAHRFQGDERDVIVFSPTVSSAMPEFHARFANNPNLVNVSVTRARRQLLIVGDRGACRALGGVLGHLATYVTDLEDGRFESPLERRLYEALVDQGIHPQPGFEAEGYRLDLAVQAEGLSLDIECDGAAFHQEQRRDAIRDVHLRDAGWQVLRLSGRDINRDLDRCVQQVVDAFAADA